MKKKEEFIEIKEWYSVTCYSRGIINATFINKKEALEFALSLGGERVIFEGHIIQRFAIDN